MQEPCPFGIARVLSCTQDGELSLQWLANQTENPNGTFKPGWTAPRTFAPYFAQERKTERHIPYTTEAEGFGLNQTDIIMHGFELTGKHTLPAPLLRAIGRHPYIWWTSDEPKPAEDLPIATPEAAAAAAAAASKVATAAAIAAGDI